ncbi:MAG TPA: hypothetical protein DCW52_01275 [Gammaproteobacteria bacterium]|nr:hypothetical protein [Gammaproteobacteria bacterium]
MNLNAIYVQSPECLLENMDGELLLYNPINTTTLHLNGSSAVVWDLCDGKQTIESIIESLQEAFPDQSDQIAADVEAVITDLVSQAALVEASQ